jgi:nucleotide-binding universal stress UspA family protein
MSEIKKILCPVDLVYTNTKALEEARVFAKAFNAEVLLLNIAHSCTHLEVYDSAASLLPKLCDDITNSATKELKTLTDKYPDIKIGTRIVFSSKPADAIVEIAQAENFDLIIMGTAAKPTMDRLLFGSVAEKVTKTSPVPVLTIRP